MISYMGLPTLYLEKWVSATVREIDRRLRATQAASVDSQELQEAAVLVHLHVSETIFDGPCEVHDGRHRRSHYVCKMGCEPLVRRDVGTWPCNTVLRVCEKFGMDIEIEEFIPW